MIKLKSLVPIISEGSWKYTGADKTTNPGDSDAFLYFDYTRTPAEWITGLIKRIIDIEVVNRWTGYDDDNDKKLLTKMGVPKIDISPRIKNISAVIHYDPDNPSSLKRGQFANCNEIRFKIKVNTSVKKKVHDDEDDQDYTIKVPDNFDIIFHAPFEGTEPTFGGEFDQFMMKFPDPRIAKYRSKHPAKEFAIELGKKLLEDLVKDTKHLDLSKNAAFLNR